MKWFDEALGANVDADENIEEISIAKIIDGEVTFGQEDGIIRNEEEDVVAKLKAGMFDSNTFEVDFRLVVPADMWERTEVVSDGNATEVVTEPMDDGRYRVRRKLRGYRPAIFEKEDTIELREFETTKQFIEWIESLSTDDVEALRQIYYDMWNFDNNSTRTRMYYELLEEEKAGRRK